ncbi:hypothetical protein C8Q74DRAFT_1291868 [Fomes fomentarius]|nr:hypothetical protein C8Q74DRAFT_1291868 [Fomes fomentarius]
MPGLLLDGIPRPDAHPETHTDDSDMEPRQPTKGIGKGQGRGQQGRRARSVSQPGNVPQGGPGQSQPVAGPSTPRLSEIDFGLMQPPFGPGGGGMFQVPGGYDEDAIGRALRAMQQDVPPNPALTHAHHSHPHPHPRPSQIIPQMPVQQQMQVQSQIPAQSGASESPQMTEMFLAALPWLQFLQAQQQQQQGRQTPSQTQQHPPPHGVPHPQPHPMQHTPFSMQHPQPQRSASQGQQQPSFTFMPPLPPQQQQLTHSFVGAHFGTLPPEMASTSLPPPLAPGPASVGNTPSPETIGTPLEPTEAETIAIAEDKRRRNTAASARFRIKKKQWTLNLERTISDLSGRVEELEREAAELRRENGWLKEIVMLKSKRLAGVVPELEPPPSTSGSGSGSGSGRGAQASGSGTGGPGEGEESESGSRSQSQRGSRESSMDVDRVGRDEKGKGRQQPP